QTAADVRPDVDAWHGADQDGERRAERHLAGGGLAEGRGERGEYGDAEGATDGDAGRDAQQVQERWRQDEGTGPDEPHQGAGHDADEARERPAEDPGPRVLVREVSGG